MGTDELGLPWYKFLAASSCLLSEGTVRVALSDESTDFKTLLEVDPLINHELYLRLFSTLAWE